MKRLKYCRGPLLALYCAAILAPASPAAAQRLVRDAAADVKHGLRDIAHVWTSPARMQTRDLEGLAVVAGVGGLLLLADGDIQEWVDENPSSAVVEALRPFRIDEPLEPVGDIWYTFRYSAAGWLVGLVFDSPTIREAAMGCMAAGVAQTLPRRLLYKVVARTRPEFTTDPYDFGVPGDSEWAGRSFPGGHAANAFTCISFIGNRYSLGLLEPVLYAAAAGASLARVPDEAHWTSDTWLGMALGYAVGRAVAQRALDRSDAEPSPAPDVRQPADLRPYSATGSGPQLGWGPNGLVLGYTHRF